MFFCPKHGIQSNRSVSGEMSPSKEPQFIASRFAAIRNEMKRTKTDETESKEERGEREREETE